MTTNHKPATQLRLLTADEIRKWQLPVNGYFLAVSNPEYAARLFNRDNAYPRLVEALRETEKVLQHRQRTSRKQYADELLADTSALLRELGEE